MTAPQGNRPGNGGPYVSPEEAAAKQLKDAGYDPNSQGFFEAFQNIVAKMKGDAAAEQQRSQQTQQLGQGVDYRTAPDPSDMAYQSIDHQELYNYVQTVNPGQVTGVSSSWTQLANAMATFGQQLTGAANSSSTSWKGGAAESAFNFVGGLGQWSDDSGRAAQLAADQVYNQSSSAENAKNAMPEPIPFSWSDEVKSWGSSNPLDLIDNIDKSIQKQKDSQDAHTQAAQVMSDYDGNLYGAAAKAPAFAPPPTFAGPTGGSIGSIGSAIIGGVGGSVQNTGGNIGSTGGSRNNISGNTANVGSSSGSLGNIGTPPSLQKGSTTGGSSNTSPGGTRAQGFAPPQGGGGGGGSSSGFGDAGLGAMGGMPMGAGMGGFGGADGDEYSSKTGRGSGGSFGPGGSGSGGSAAGSGSGAQSGARAGGAGAAESAAHGAGGRGAAASGASGRGAMGAGAGGAKGQGEEDEEHDRPSWLVEPDPDEVFGNNERTAPPVIGE
jgi:hypothetical protein